MCFNSVYSAFYFEDYRPPSAILPLSPHPPHVRARVWGTTSSSRVILSVASLLGAEAVSSTVTEQGDILTTILTRPA